MLLAWGLAYSQLVPVADGLAGLLPLTLVVFGMGVVRSFFSAERTRALLAGRQDGRRRRRRATRKPERRRAIG